MVSSGGHSIFGSLSHVSDANVGSAAIFIIIGVVLVIEYCFHRLNRSTRDTPYREMVNAIQKELMVVGSCAFLFKVYLSFNSIEEMWFISLEYADILIPITSFFFCFQGMILVLFSMMTCSYWSKASHLKVDELLYEFLNFTKETQARLLKYSWFPLLTPMMDEFEFRIFQTIFLEKFNMHHKALEFDVYCSRVYEKYLGSIVEMTYLDWFVLSCFIVLNWWRNYLKLDVFDCHELAHDEFKADPLLHEYYVKHHSHGGAHFEEEMIHRCENLASLELFAYCGFVITGATITTAIVSRYYVLAIMKKKGINCGADYIQYLRSKEKELECEVIGTVEAKVVKRIDTESLKDIVNDIKLKNKKLKRRHPKGHWYQSTLKAGWAAVISSISHVLGRVYNTFCKRAATISTSASSPNDNGLYSPSGSVNGDFEFSSLDDPESANRAQNADETKRLSTSPQRDSIAMYLKEKQASKVGPADNDVTGSGKAEGDELDNVNGSGSRNKPNDSDSKPEYQYHELNKVNTELVPIFIGGNPAYFFNFVKILMTIQAFYMSLMLTNYIFSAVNNVHSGEWAVAVVLPVSISMVIYIYIIKCCVMFKVVLEMDYDSIDETLEETEAQEALGSTVREKILAKLHVMGDPEIEILKLFESLDSDGSQDLSRSEMELLLNELEITFSRKRWNLIYQTIDRNFDDKISFDELFLFLFPKHDVILRQENRRLKRLQKHASHHLAAYLKPAEGVKKRLFDRSRTVLPRNKSAPAFVSSSSSEPPLNEKELSNEQLVVKGRESDSNTISNDISNDINSSNSNSNSNYNVNSDANTNNPGESTTH